MKDPKTYPFEIRYESYEGLKYYHAVFPDFPDVDGTGKTASEAIECGWEALESYFIVLEEQGAPIPEPKSHPLTTGASGRVTLRLPKKLHARLIQEAERDGMSLNSEIVTAVATYFGMPSTSEEPMKKPPRKKRRKANL